MFTDARHNAIVGALVTPAFLDRLKEELLPTLEAKYGSELMGVCMYEDFLDPALTVDGYYHYPLTLILPTPKRQWIRWSVSNKRRFDNGIPYSYNGTAPLGIEAVDSVSADMEAVVAGKALYYTSDSMKITVHAESVDPLSMVGKYSQTFVDEMARQLTSAISRIMGVKGLEKTEIELALTFAGGSYMEHTSENVTYRRLLLSDKSCQARDFWVKWTRLDGHTAYTVADDVRPEDILFEIGEDVPQKIREKEFRFLCRVDPAKYQSAMGKKTATEWRDIIKRAIRRGDVVKTALVVDEKPVVSRVPEEDDITRLAREAVEEYERRLRMLEGSEQTAEATEQVAETTEQVAEAAEQAVETTEQVAEVTAEQIANDAAQDAEEAEPAEQTVEAVAEVTAEDVHTAEETAAIPLFGLDLGEQEQTEEQVSAENTDGVFGLGAIEQEQTLVLREDKPRDADAVAKEEYARQMAIAMEQERAQRERAERERAEELEKMRRELEESLRREYEQKAEQTRLLHEQEQERIRQEERERAEKMLRDRQTELEKARLLVEENQRIQQEAQALKDEIARKDRREIKERELVAEAARIAVEEQRRIEAEKRAVEEQRRIAEAEQSRALEEQRLAGERELERQRLMREAQEARERAQRLAALHTQPQPVNLVAETEKTESEPQPYFIERSAKILFRDDVVDLNVIKKIRDIVERTLISEKKEDLRIFMKAYPREQSVIVLDVKLPQDEQPLLITIIKAIGNGGLGVTKITLE